MSGARPGPFLFPYLSPSVISRVATISGISTTVVSMVAISSHAEIRNAAGNYESTRYITLFVESQSRIHLLRHSTEVTVRSFTGTGWITPATKEFRLLLLAR